MRQLLIVENLYEQKQLILSYFKQRGQEIFSKVDKEIATNEYKKKAKILNKNIDWEKDLAPSTTEHLKNNNLLKYLEW